MTETSGSETLTDSAGVVAGTEELRTSEDPPGSTDSTESVGSTAYELLRQRLVGHGDDLTARANRLNDSRLETFGSSRFEVAGVERIRTDNNTVPRDIASAGGDLLFGYNVFIGLKTETTVDDVFSLHHYRAEGDSLALDPVPDEAQDNWLHDPSFQNDFRELYTYYKDARLLQLQRREGRLLAAFQTGNSLEDLRVFRWNVSPDGEVTYLDNRGERDYVTPEQFDFEWSPVTREHHVPGRNPHVNIVDRVFVDPTGGSLEIRIEDNTTEGEVLLTESVEDPDQSIADCSMSFAVLGDLVVLRVLPYREEEPRGYVVNTFARTARRNDALLESCLRLPEDHGLITPAGFELRTGESKLFDLKLDDMRFETTQRSPNGEDVLYVFHERGSGLSVMLGYNVIRREVGTPIVAHGWTVFDDGSLIVFREDDEPTRVHPMQIWRTPFVSDEFHARQPVGDTMMHRVGNADLVRGISDSLNISRQIREATPSSAVYADLSASAARVIDGHHWLVEGGLGNLAESLDAIRSTSGLIIDEFEKVQTLRATATGAVEETRADIDELLDRIDREPPADANAHVDMLRELRRHRGHVITMRDIRYVDTDALDELDARLSANFDVASGNAAEFFAGDDAFVGFHDSLGELETAIGTAPNTAELREPAERIDELGEGLDVLTQVVTGLQIDDPTVRTAILERLSDVTAGLNRVRAVSTNRRKELATAEGSAAFSVEMTLFAQAVTSELSRADTPSACDEALGRLLLQLEELESRFAEFDDELVEIASRRDEVYETLQARKQGLLDERQRQSQRLVDAADRILGGIARRIERFEDTDEMNAWFVADPMVEKVRSLADDLRDLDQAVSADELIRRLDTAREDAGRSLRDRADIYEEGGSVIRLGQHRFSVDTEPLELTVGVFDDQLNAVLTGTDYREPLDVEQLAGTEDFWNQHLPSETAGLARAPYLAASILLDAITGTDGLDLDQLAAAANADGGLGALVQDRAQTRVDEGYERGVHDHDATRILSALRDAVDGVGLLRHPPAVRADAIVHWATALDSDEQSELRARARSLGRLADQFGPTPAMETLVDEVATAIEAHGHATSPWASARYLVDELAEDVLEFDTTAAALDLAEAFRAHHDAGDRSAAAVDDVTDVHRRLSLTHAWFDAFVTATRPELAPLIPEAVAIVALPDQPRMPATAHLDVSVDGLLSAHATITSGVWSGRADELLGAVDVHRRRAVPRFREYQQTRADLLDATRDQLRLDEFQPKIMSAFVRNRLIDRVYLPLIGDNLAKQLGSLDSGRTDQMGLLLLISPPGYGKTTLMEYVANRLGMVFVKVNGPALGHSVTSLDPADAPDATAAQEVDKINFALEMGSNVLLYLDDIQHTHPELLQKFISMTDAQRRMEGVWNGRTRTYDMRGKRFAVVMAGNPYTESGERFAIPDMLANRADTYNLGDVLSGREDDFALSYIENALASSPVLNAMTTHDLADVSKLVEMAQGGPVTAEDFSHPYAAAELAEMEATMQRLLRVRDVLLLVNRTYIESASMADDYRTEPAFRLQGSYRNMARLAEKVLPVMNDAELEALLDDHYRGEAQTLTTDAEANLLKLGELRGILEGEREMRWNEIRSTFQRSQRIGGDDLDPTILVAENLHAINETLRRHRQS